jgi:hypothetical protein
VARLRSETKEVGFKDSEPSACTSNPSCSREREIRGKEEKGK